MRARPAAVAAALTVLAACTSGGGRGGGPRPTPTTAATITPAPSVPPAPLLAVDPAGSVTLRVSGLTLPDLRSGGSGLRVVVRATTPRLTVRRRGGGGPAAVCPLASAAAPVTAGDCVELAPGATVELAAAGLELRATGPTTTVEEMAVAYLPVDRAVTLVTPARPAGACAPAPCEATFSLGPARPGAFVLDGRPPGGRSRLVLTALARVGTSGSNRMVATVEGGGSLSIRATLDADSEASLLHHQQEPGPVAPMTAEILWP